MAKQKSPGSEIGVKLDTIQGVAAQLNSLADQVNEKIDEVNAFLMRAGVGVEVWLGTPIAFETEDRWCVMIGYARSKDTNRFTLMYKEAAGDVIAEGQLKHLKRDERLKAMRALPALLEAICVRLKSDAAGAADALSGFDERIEKSVKALTTSPPAHSVAPGDACDGAKL